MYLSNRLGRMNGRENPVLLSAHLGSQKPESKDRYPTHFHDLPF